jgi:hypothetical protein
MTGRRVLVGAGVAAIVALAAAAEADTLLLTNADLVAGRIDMTELSVTTETGVVRLAPGDVVAVELDGIGGDVVQLRRGGLLTGRLAGGAFVVRLGSGQDLTVARGTVRELRFQPR